MLAVVGSGALLGEMALIDDQPRSASAVALEPTECLLITRDSFHTLVRKDPEIAWCIVPTLAERMRELLRTIESEDTLDLGGVERLGAPVGADRAVAHLKEESEEDRADEDEDLDGDEGFAAVGLLRAQHALLMASVTGLSDSVELWGTFFR